jgi:hypothetical protein
MPYEAHSLNSPSPAEPPALSRDLELEGNRLLSAYRRLRLGIRLKNVSLPDELEQDG